MSIIASLQPVDDPAAPAINITSEHVQKFREVMREDFRDHGGDPSTLSRRNSFFIEGKEAVTVLDKAGFDYGCELDLNQKFWFVIFAARSLRRLRGNPRFAPRYIEVF